MESLSSLEVWQVGREVARATYALTLRCPLERHYALSDVIRRAALTIPASVAQGHAIRGREVRIRCWRTALSAATALKCHLELGIELRLLDARSTRPVLNGCDRLVGLLQAMTRRISNGHGRRR